MSFARKSGIVNTQQKTPEPLKSLWRAVACPICSEIYKVPNGDQSTEHTCSNGHTYLLEGNAAGFIDFMENFHDGTSEL